MAIARKLIRDVEEKEKTEQEPKPLIYKPVQVGPELPSVNHFYTSYTTHASVFIFSRLPAYYAVDLTDAGHVRHATHAVALLSASKSLRQSGLMLQARWHYCKALSTLNHALQDPIGVRDDANLVTLFLFGLYEVINGPRAGTR
ncbi:C6 zinc finger domain-containing protein [Colletotrichum tofieldiae]|nr:C6 zinc finger domain-containing protein [Colletotrichum tofieldiae]